ncbi:MAG: ATP-binding protein, partial [Treponema sp.]|nr:ATP-binding protein [Treponema sp.]
MRIFSFSPFGYEGSLVSVEVDLRRGIPAVDVVGLADGTVKESRERMQAAIRNSCLDFPLERVLISLSPADLKKEGAGFDLPIALGVLCAQK